MISIAFAFFSALTVAAILTPLVRRFALAAGVVDQPTARRVHTRQVPRLGGIAIVLGFFVPLAVLFAVDTATAHIFFANPRMPTGLVVGAILVTALGLFDDVRGVGAKVKLLVQVTAACAAYAGGLRIDAISLPGIGFIDLGWMALPATILWITAIVNALNLIDGLDGLAAGIAFFACLTNFVVAYLGGNVLVALVTATLAGSIIGFLFHNFNPAKIFMGDAGSLFLGYVLACGSLLGAANQKTPTLIAILVPLIALGLPIMDMLFAIARRFLERRSIFSADRGHIHHRLLDGGLTHRRAVLTLYALSFAFTVAALAIHLGRSWQIGGALLALAAAVIGIVRFVGYFNAALSARVRTTRDSLTERLRRTVPATLARMESAKSATELAGLLEAFALESGLLAVGLDGAPSAPSTRTRPVVWRWETRDLQKRTFDEAVAARFPLGEDDVTETHNLELQFQWDSPTAAVAPQCEILLQLVADASAALLQRAPVNLATTSIAAVVDEPANAFPSFSAPPVSASSTLSAAPFAAAPASARVRTSESTRGNGDGDTGRMAGEVDLAPRDAQAV